MNQSNGAVTPASTGAITGKQRLLCTTALAGAVLLAGLWAGTVRADDAATAQVHAPSLPQTETETADQAQADRTVTLDLPAQKLSAALVAFSGATGIDIVFDGQVPADRQAPALKGEMTAAAALNLLLKGTGITWTFSDAKTVALSLPKTGERLTLGTVSVEGRGETAHGPADGYVAHRSATSTKTDTPLIETPQSISVVTADQIRATKAGTSAEALRYTTGVLAEAAGTQPGTDVYSIRGFTDTVGNLYQDGMRRAGGNFFGYDPTEPYSLERVETLRGPSSVLYGLNNPGGMVNLVTKRPKQTPHGEVQLSGGSHDKAEGTFDIGGPVYNDKRFSYRVTGLVRDSDTQVDFVENNRQFLAGAFTWRPTTATELTVLTDWIRHDGQYIQPVPAAGAAKPNDNGEIDTSLFIGEPGYDSDKNRRLAGGYRLEHRFDDTLAVRQNLQYSHLDMDRFWLGTGTLQNDGRSLSRNVYANKFIGNVLTIDNHVQKKLETGPLSHSVLVGLDYHRLDYKSEGRYSGGSVANLDIFAPSYGAEVTYPNVSYFRDMDLDQIGLYGQNQIKWDNWSLLVGGRHDWARNIQENLLNNTYTRQHDSALTGRAGLVYLFDNGLAPYVSYSESFDPVSGTDAQGNAFEPETGTQYEIGMKYQPAGYNAFVTISAFDLKRQNVTTQDPNNTNFNIQTGEVSTQGIEVEGKASLAMGLDLTASYAFIDAEVTKSNNTNLGKAPNRVPKHAAALWTQYTPEDGSLQGWSFGLGARYVGATFGDSTNSFKVKSSTVFDASLGFDFGSISQQLSGTKLEINAINLLDKSYVAACDGACFFGTRRTITATLRHEW
ncbi:MAG: TonB-dependent siderophore receptor [Rhodospirillales bacterium]